MGKKYFINVSLLLFIISPCPAITIYVDDDAPPGGDGQSWETAYKYLQDALDAATGDPNQIWVAQGTYYPDPCGLADPREACFQMINGVAIYGGFPDSGNPNWPDRDTNQYETILSGDPGSTGDPNDYSYHIFYHPGGTNLDSTALLDGFTITRSNANVRVEHIRGGGMCNEGYSSPTVSNCTFTGNSAYYGGGMSNRKNSSAKVTGCTFSDNLAYNYGGGMHNMFSSSPMVTKCTFSGNSASAGGGMYNYDYSSPQVTGCTFSNNSGGDCGGMHNSYYCSPTVMGCTFTGNSAYYGGGMRNFNNSSPTVTNCILWDNIASNGNEIYNTSSTPVISYCDISGCFAGGSWDGSLGNDGGGNIDVDPLFVDPNRPDGIIGTEDDNLRLLPRSPCIDAGDPSYYDPNYLIDLDGHLRYVDGDCDGNIIVDMGAYEYDQWREYGDFTGDCRIDMGDFSVLAVNWQGDNSAIDIAPPAGPDGVIDIKELLVMAEYWLAGAGL